MACVWHRIRSRMCESIPYIERWRLEDYIRNPDQDPGVGECVSDFLKADVGEQKSTISAKPNIPRPDATSYIRRLWGGDGFPLPSVVTPYGPVQCHGNKSKACDWSDQGMTRAR